MKKISVKMLVFLGLLVALEIVLNRFLSINAWNLKIGFNFVPIAVGGILFGPIGGGIVGALGDFLGAILFPIGPYFPGFTVTSFLFGVVFGLFLHKKQTTPNIIFAVLINQCLLSQCLNTLWISIAYGSPYGPLFISRLVQTGVLIVVQFVVLRLIAAPIKKYVEKTLS